MMPQPLRAPHPVRESFRVLGLYVRAQILIAVLLMLLYAIGFAIARVPWWPVIAIMGGLASAIPRVGAFIPLIVAILASLLGGRDLTHILLAFGVWVVVQALEGFLITPRLLSKPLGLNAWLVFFALLAGSFFFGPVGLILAVPLLAVAGVFYRYFRNRRGN